MMRLCHEVMSLVRLSHEGYVMVRLYHGSLSHGEVISRRFIGMLQGH